MEYLPLLVIVPLLRLIVSDFRSREVPILWLGILAIGTVCISLILDGWLEVLKRSLQNLLLILYMSTGVVLWGCIKARRFINPLNVYIGLGDLIFFLILTPLFSVRQYAQVMIACLIFSLVWWGIEALRRENPPKNVPFIATSGIVLAGIIVYKVFCE
jgi:hypothetical protein